MKIIPTIFATSKIEFNKRFYKLTSVSNDLHIDFMDGKFVESKSLRLSEIPDLKKFKNNFEAHLMTEKPEKYLASLKKKGFKKIIFHFESTNNLKKVIRKAESLRFEIFLAINPETKVSSITPYIKKVQGILIMGVHPGKERQSLLPEVIKKIQDIKKLNKKVLIQIDGGVNPRTARLLRKAGASILNSGSFVMDAKNPKNAIKKLKQ